MLIKLIVVGTLGYIGLKILQSTQNLQAAQSSSASELRLAGGPLSEHAIIQHSPGYLPAKPT